MFCLRQANNSYSKEEMRLLDDDVIDTLCRSQDHELRTAPIMTRDAYVVAEQSNLGTQYGVLGKVLSTW